MHYPLLVLAFFIVATTARATDADWKEGAVVPAEGRPNIYSLTEGEWASAITRGKLHALTHPVPVTGILMPKAPIAELLKLPPSHLLKRQFIKSFRLKKDLTSLEDLYAWLGLNEYPGESAKGVYAVPYPGGKRPAYRMGVTETTRDGAVGITFACASCHSGQLFGKTVLGLTTRFPRANEFFTSSKSAISQVPTFAFQLALGATAGEAKLYSTARHNIRFVDARLPLHRGLDTSLSHTAMSLARRAPDAFASRELYYAENPDPEPLAKMNADSKPSVWWNLKYKNRWLSDGSVVSGNPIHTNFLWNEIGRGTDLNELAGWLDNHDATVRDLTTAVFATEPPRYTDFFPAESIDYGRARRGGELFQSTCAKCHGTYTKNWSRPDADKLPLVERLKTARVEYFENTPVIDVGTDPTRYLGMVSLAPRLNRLEIALRSGVKMVPQTGYVPPPLVGIWSRWPYFHNNSAPSLCAVLTRASERPKHYFAGEAKDPALDFDADCNGYPLGEKTPAAWKEDTESTYDGTKPGLAPTGHDEGIFLASGKELYSAAEKRDIVEFLKTL